ncbi:MAG: hypothetical protein HY964_08025 [Ignavibacteriales bacterium]|nr:hypothetical protein [Ignavibacteriales bacterium]
MASSFKYRSVALLLAGIFSVFNIGLPVVLHYCKMMETVSRNSCGMCDIEKMDTDNIQVSKTASSCCKTILGVDRNKTEFLESQQIDVAKFQHSITTILHTSPGIDFKYRSNIYFTTTYSPPLFEDIPIFTSSLLI